MAGWEGFFEHIELDKVMQCVTYMNIMTYDNVTGGAFYGRAWKGVPPENNGLYQMNSGAWPGPTRYSNIRESLEDKNGFVRYWDTIAKAPCLYNAADSIFISYEDTISIRLKTRYAKDNGMGGIMFWQLAGDAEQDGLVDAIYAEKMRH